MLQHNEVFQVRFPVLFFLCGLKDLKYNLSKFKVLSGFNGALGTENRGSDLCTYVNQNVYRQQT